MPPSNTTAATATLITTFPYDVTQTDINAGGVNYDVWYTFTAPPGAQMMSLWGFSGNLSAGYRPTLKPYDEVASISPINGIAAQNKPAELEVVPGEDYWLKFEANLNDAVANTVRVRVSVLDPQPILRGSIIINSDHFGFPLTACSHTTSHQVLDVVSGIATGEAGDVLPDGTMCFGEKTDKVLKIYDLNFAETFASAVQPTNIHVKRNADATTFWVATYPNGGPVTLRTLSAAGTFGASQVMTGVTSLGIGAFCAGPGDAVLYFAQGPDVGYGLPIQTWNLETQTLIGDWTAGYPNTFVSDILALSDGTLLASYESISVPDIVVRHFNAAGAVLRTYAVGQNSLAAARLAWALDTPVSFWVMTHPPSTNVSYFQNIRVTDGTVITALSQTLFQDGVYLGTATATPTALFGPPDSCPLLIMHGVGSGGGGGVPASYHLEERLIRRLRRAPHLANEHLRTFYKKFELDLERGVGRPTGQGEDPMVMLRLSRDGGHTWSEPVLMSAGRLGVYTQRVIARRLGLGRDVVFEVTVSDPVAWSLVQAWLDLEAGTN